MPNTPKGLTYPSDASPVAVPADIEELATDVDGLIVPNTGGTYTGSVSFTQSPSVPTPTSGLHAVNKTYADAINTDVTALETELGANPSGTFSTVADRLNTHDHPASSTDNTIARYDGTTGKIQGSTVVVDDNGRLTTPTGASGGYGFVSGAVNLTGTGAPESVITAPIGSTYLQTDATNDVKGWIRWVKASGSSSTGWIAGPEADTGYRIVTSGVTPGANITLNYVYLHRAGSVVTVSGDYTYTGASTSGSVITIFTLPSGFTPPNASIRDSLVVNSSGLDPRPLFLRSGQVQMYGGTQDGRYRFHETIITRDGWPSTLPGTAG